jgi:hypothetical protein
LKWSRTNSRIADDKLPCRRLPSISLTKSESVKPRSLQISFALLQNGSSRLTLVLWPLAMIDRFTMGDFMISSLKKRTGQRQFRSARP